MRNILTGLLLLLGLSAWCQTTTSYINMRSLDSAFVNHPSNWGTIEYDVQSGKFRITNGAGVKGDLIASYSPYLVGKANLAMPPVVYTSNHTLSLNDLQRWVIFNTTSAVNLTVPNNSTVAFPIGTQIPFYPDSTGQLTVVQASGVNVIPPVGGTLLSTGQRRPMYLYKKLVNTWQLFSSSGGGGGGSGVSSITGDGVDNTDPANPVLTFPTVVDIGAQPVDTDLTIIAGLSASNDDFLQRKSGAWANRTIAQVKTDLNLSGTNTGDQTSVTGNAGTATALATARTIGILTGDATSAGSSFNGTANNTNALTLATVNGNVGSFGSATQTGTFTVNAKGLITAASNTTVTPSISSITGLGTGVQTALGINIGSAGAPILFNGPAGTPSSLNGTNVTGVPVSTGISGLATNMATFLATPSSSNLASTLTDEAGSTGGFTRADYVDAKVADAINDGVTTIASSENAVFDALALKVSSQWVTSGSDIYYNTGGVLVGATGNPSAKLHIVETITTTPRGGLFDQYSTGVTGSRVSMRKARGTFASPTTIVTADVLGSFSAWGHDGTAFIESARLLMTSAGTIGTSIIPSKIDIQTSNSSGTLSTGLTIDQSQTITFPAYTTANGILYTNGSGVLSQATVGSLPGFGTGVGSWLVTPSWTNFNSAITGTAPYWSAATGVTLTGANTIAVNTAGNLAFGGAWTATASNQFSGNFGGSFTARPTTNDVIMGYKFNPTFIMAGSGQTAIALHVDMPILSGGTTPTAEIFRASYNNTVAFTMLGQSRFGFGASGGPFIATTTGTTTQSEGLGNASLMLESGGVWGGANHAAIQVIPRQSSSASAGQVGVDITNQTGNSTWVVSSGTNTFTFLRLNPAWNVSGGTNTTVMLDMTGTNTSVAGISNFYGIVDGSSHNHGLGTTSPTATLHVVGTAKVEGSLTLPVAGNGLLIKEGTNATMGVATLVAGTVTVNTTKVTANSRIHLTGQNLGTITVPVGYAISARVAGTSFTILSANVVDTSIVAWEILEPAP